jgi:hypothetical protein
MSVGNISYQGTALPFLAATFPAGTFDDEPVAQAEELITPGINGRRWRTLFLQFPAFQMTTTHEATEYATAALTKARAEKMVQKLVTLQVTIDGVAYSMRQVHVSAVIARLFPGPVYGAGTGSGEAHLDLTWQMELTDFEAAAGT